MANDRFEVGLSDVVGGEREGWERPEERGESELGDR